MDGMRFAYRLLVLFMLAALLAVPLAGVSLAQGAGGEGEEYTVQADDSLWKLAEKYLGDGNRFGEIVEATNAKHAEDSAFALIDDPGIIHPGSRLWIPAPGAEQAAAAPAAAPTVTTSPVVGAGGSPGGHIAFSFWNNGPGRCTYEINVIDVQACLESPGKCQANRLVFSLNNVSEPALSPDGARIAFRGWGEPSSEDSPYKDCAPAIPYRYLVNATLDGTDLKGTGGYYEDSHPDWSPDGKRILFDSARHSDRVSRIMLIDADGANEHELRIAGQQPTWAPDGDRFAFRGCDMTGNRCGIWQAHAVEVMSWDAGKNLIGPVVEELEAAHPDWSPNSEQIVYQSPKGGSYDLYVVNADGSGLRRLTSDPSVEGLPAWSPDGEWIAYVSDSGGNWGIWAIKADGSEQHKLFSYDGGIYALPKAVDPYGQRDWLDEQISWSN